MARTGTVNVAEELNLCRGELQTIEAEIRDVVGELRLTDDNEEWKALCDRHYDLKTARHNIRQRMMSLVKARRNGMVS